ncbi:MAG: MlaD family protein, partial [Chitinivibrionales bacterium]|nr:MlaD family protein [Chitinivibrionales bacterium]
MKKSNMELMVGGSILLAVFILIASVLWLKEISVLAKLVSYTVLFPNVSTLQPGDPVMVNGVKKGMAQEIFLRNQRVAVEIALDKSVGLTDSARITVQNIGIMGERMI